MQHCLLALTFTKTQEIAQPMELAEIYLQSIQADAQTPVHKIATSLVPNKDHLTQPVKQSPSGGQGKHAATGTISKMHISTAIVKLVTYPECANLRHSKEQIQSTMNQKKL